MDRVTFQSFVKEAMALQAGPDEPADYAITKAAVMRKLGMAPVAAGSRAARLLSRQPLGIDSERALSEGLHRFQSPLSPSHIPTGMVSASGPIRIGNPTRAISGEIAMAKAAGIDPEILTAFLKTAWDWHKFREGVEDEGIPLAGATIGAVAGKGLRGAALGYAAGSGASLLRSKLKGEKPSKARKILALSGLGYGAGGITHGVLEKAVVGRAASKGEKVLEKARKWFPGHGAVTRRSALLEEGIPAAGAVLGTGLAYGSHKNSPPPEQRPA
jgi:hypothetical protein